MEDQKHVTDVLSEALEDEYRVSTAAHAPAALGKLATENVNLLLLDLMLPGGGASDVLARASDAGIPIVVMSGSPDELRGEQTRDLPSLEKPFRLNELFDTVRKAVENP